MQDTDAVSCILCLQADEYGSMIKVCVPPGQIPPSPERVICRRCAAIIANATLDDEGEEIGRDLFVAEAVPPAVRDVDVGGDAGSDEWDSGLPDRTTESVGQSDSADGGNPPGSSKE